MKKNIAERLLEIGAVTLRPDKPFIWASGLRSPIYCDNRQTLSYPDLRREIAQGLKELIIMHYPSVELIAGTATAGIPHAAWVSDIMNLPMCYVRSKPKDHGTGNQIEGKVSTGQKVVVVEDLISTGGSVIATVEALREAGCKVLGVVSIFTYQLPKGAEMLNKACITAYSLTDFSTLAEVAKQKGIIKEEDEAVLAAWRRNPEEWGK
ncbi:MAG TPA: orotate phosphoribosyltransferase [Clostridiales bacterium]|nr:orotate phosphoribosyltransferase [Clostridiales bacterium]